VTQSKVALSSARFLLENDDYGKAEGLLRYVDCQRAWSK